MNGSQKLGRRRSGKKDIVMLVETLVQLEFTVWLVNNSC